MNREPTRDFLSHFEERHRWLADAMLRTHATQQKTPRKAVDAALREQTRRAAVAGNSEAMAEMTALLLTLRERQQEAMEYVASLQADTGRRAA